ncbi:MAG: hypothetical protein LRY71_05490 [Bacillaceae bacterium]|nr:hypothetical protein [Bacillaceae bacterium]
MKRNYKDLFKKQLNSILRETENPAIIQDVTDTEFGVIPGAFDADEMITKNSTDGKTWTNLNK